MKKFLLVLLIVLPLFFLKDVHGATHTSLTCSREELTNEELIQIESLIYAANDFYGKSKFDFSKYNFCYCWIVNWVLCSKKNYIRKEAVSNGES